MKNRLIASAPSAEELLKMIAKYFYGEPWEYAIYEIITNRAYEATVIKQATGKELSGYVVKKKQGRYRFERVTA